MTPTEKLLRRLTLAMDQLVVEGGGRDILHGSWYKGSHSLRLRV